MENRLFLQSFYSASIGFYRIADWRVGGESTHKSASSVYSSSVGRINIQTLNYPETFDFSGEGQAIRGWPGTDRFVRSTASAVPENNSNNGGGRVRNK